MGAPPLKVPIERHLWNFPDTLMPVYIHIVALAVLQAPTSLAFFLNNHNYVVRNTWLIALVHRMSAPGYFTGARNVVVNDGAFYAANEMHIHNTQVENGHVIREITKESVVDWLRPLDFDEKLCTCISQRQPNTCMWLIENDRISSWRSKPGSLVWLHGIPGNGKTILVSALIDHLSSTKTADECLAYAYCDFRRPESQDPVNIFRTILAELVMNFEGNFASEFEHLISLQRRMKNPPGNLSKLIDLIKEASKLWKNPLVVIDALDESHDRESLLNAIQQLTEHGHISFFVTSRKEKDISEALDTFSTISLKEEQEKVQNDINHHIQEEIANRHKLRNLSSTLKTTLYSQLSTKADGMFRWAQCQLDFIATRKTFKGVQDALNNLPTGLFPTYERILNGIEDAGEETATIAKRSLRWILGAAPPLRLSQIAEAIMIEPRKSALNEDLTLISSDIILEVCSSLLLHDASTDTVTLSHFSVQEYLFSKHLDNSSLMDYCSISPHHVHLDLSILLLTYLSLEEFCRDLCSTAEELQNLIEEHPLLPYAARYWHNYVEHVEFEDEVLFKTILATLLDRSEPHCHHLIQQALHESKDFAELTFPRFSHHYTNPIYYIFTNGRPFWVLNRLLIERPYLATYIFSPWAGNPLVIACKQFQGYMIDLLLERGADIEQTIELEGQTRHGLSYAIDCGNFYATRAFIKHGTDVNRAMPGGWTPLHEAVATGSLRFVEALVEAGCTMNPQTSSGKTPLMIAFEMQQPTVARYLLDNGATVDELGGLTQSQIEWAVSESWYPQLRRIVRPTSSLEPLNLNKGQVMEVAQYLTDDLHVPPKIVAKIFDMAEYWIMYSVEREELMIYSESDESYVSISVVGKTVKRIVFTIVSHDQGFSDHPHEHGSYWNSWTWFEAGHSGSPYRKRILANLHASWKSHMHTIVWDYREPKYKDWVDELYEGCIVTVYARAKYQGWTNYVERAQITVYSSCI